MHAGLMSSHDSAFAPPWPNPSSRDVHFSWTVPAELANVPAKLILHDSLDASSARWNWGWRDVRTPS